MELLQAFDSLHCQVSSVFCSLMLALPCLTSGQICCFSLQFFRLIENCDDYGSLVFLWSTALTYSPLSIMLLEVAFLPVLQNVLSYFSFQLIYVLMNLGALRKYLVVTEAMIRTLVSVHSLLQNTCHCYPLLLTSLLGVAPMSCRYDCQQLPFRHVMEDCDFYPPTSSPIGCLVACEAGLGAVFLESYFFHLIYFSV